MNSNPEALKRAKKIIADTIKDLETNVLFKEDLEPYASQFVEFISKSTTTVKKRSCPITCCDEKTYKLSKAMTKAYRKYQEALAELDNYRKAREKKPNGKKPN